MKKLFLIIIAIIILSAVGGGAFYGGMVYGKSQNARSFANGGNFQGARNRQNNTAGTDLIFGNIVSKNENSITLELPNNGGSKIIFYSDSTQISKFVSGSSSDLAENESVSISGTANSDGSITAQTIQIRPAGQNLPGLQNLQK